MAQLGSAWFGGSLIFQLGICDVGLGCLTLHSPTLPK